MQCESPGTTFRGRRAHTLRKNVYVPPHEARGLPFISIYGRQPRCRLSAFLDIPNGIIASQKGGNKRDAMHPYLYESLRCVIFEDPWLTPLTDTLPYGFLFAYTLDLASNARGNDLEDSINKPDRPIVSRQTTVAATKRRYCVAIGVWTLYSYFLNIHRWMLLWVITVFASYSLHTANFGPTKDLSMVLGTTVQLMACWELGGSNIEVGWSWVRMIGAWVFFTAPIKDFRDVPGDKASGRRTTPILLGDTLGMSVSIWKLILLSDIKIQARVYTSCSLIVFEVSSFLRLL